MISNRLTKNPKSLCLKLITAVIHALSHKFDNNRHQRTASRMDKLKIRLGLDKFFSRYKTKEAQISQSPAVQVDTARGRKMSEESMHASQQIGLAYPQRTATESSDIETNYRHSSDQKKKSLLDMLPPKLILKTRATQESTRSQSSGTTDDVQENKENNNLSIHSDEGSELLEGGQVFFDPPSAKSKKKGLHISPPPTSTTRRVVFTDKTSVRETRITATSGTVSFQIMEGNAQDGAIAVPRRSDIFGELEDLMMLQLTADRDFAAPVIMSVSIHDFQLIKHLNEADGTGTFLGILKSPDLRDRNKLFQDQRVRIKLIYPRRNETERLQQRRFINQLAIYCHFTSCKARGRTPKLLAFHDKGPVYMIATTVHPCTLETFIEGRGFVNGRRTLHFGTVKNLMVSIISTLDEVHQLGFVHRRICPKIVHVDLVPERDYFVFRATLDGFDLLELVEQETVESIATIPLDEMVYFSPERISLASQRPGLLKRGPVRTREDRFKSDIFSFGSLCFYMINQTHPYYGTQDEIIDAMLHGDLPSYDPSSDHMLDGTPRTIGDALVEMIEGCWNRDPKQRPTPAVLSSILRKMDEEMRRRERIKRKPMNLIGRLIAEERSKSRS